MALRFDGTQNYLSLGTLGTLGANLNSGFYLSFDMITTSTGQGALGSVNAASKLGVQIYINQDITGASVTNLIRVFVEDDANHQLKGAMNTPYNFTDGLKHTIRITVNVVAKTIAITIDGNVQSITYSLQNTLTTYTNFTAPFLIAATNQFGTPSNYYACTMSNISIGTTSSTLYGVYPLTDGTGTSATDQSGNGNNGTLQKGAGAYPLWLGSGSLLAFF